MKVKVISAVKLDSGDKSTIEKQIRRLFRDQEIQYEVDPDILGGLMIVSGDEQIDLTIRAKLNDLNHYLKELS